MNRRDFFKCASGAAIAAATGGALAEAIPMFPVQELAPDFNLAYTPLIMGELPPGTITVRCVLTNSSDIEKYFGATREELHAAREFFDVHIGEDEVALLPPIDIAVGTI